MTAQPAFEHTLDDPVEILRLLPEQHHEQFLTEYGAAVDAARRPQHYRQLHDLLRLWRLRAAAYSDPDYHASRAAVDEAARTGNYEAFVPIEDVIPDWTEQVERRRSERDR